MTAASDDSFDTSLVPTLPREEKALTTPVFMQPKPQEINGLKGFVILQKVATGHISAPFDASVRIQKRNGDRFAVIRFTGRPNADTVSQNEFNVREWIDNKNLLGSARTRVRRLRSSLDIGSASPQ